MSAPPPTSNPDTRVLPEGWVTQLDSKYVFKVVSFVIFTTCSSAPSVTTLGRMSRSRSRYLLTSSDRYYVNTRQTPPEVTWTHPLGPPPPPPQQYGPPAGPPPPNQTYGGPGYDHNGYGQATFLPAATGKAPKAGMGTYLILSSSFSRSSR